MRVCGVIAEYNPFHEGHAYHLRQIREAGATHIVVALSGMMVQRGGLAMWRKHARARMALAAGADVIFELPAPFSCSAAQTFARAGVSLLAAAGADTISFGSERGNLEALKRIAALSDDAAYDDIVRTLLAQGVSYPAAAGQAAGAMLDSEPLNTPNDALGVEYMRAARTLGLPLGFHTVERLGAAHDAMHASGGYASSSHLRALIARDGLDSIRGLVPPAALDILAGEVDRGAYIADRHDYNLLALYALRQLDEAQLAMLPDVSEGLDNRLTVLARSAATLDDFLDAVKTKRYTMARLRRIVGYALLGAVKTDIAGTPACLRLLGFSERGRELLTQVKAHSPLPMLSSLADIEKLSPACAKQAHFESRAYDLFSMCQKDKHGAGEDYRNLVIIT